MPNAKAPKPAKTKARPFSLPDQDGKLRTLADWKGKWLVLYFYPRDNTPGCSIEAVNFTKMLPEFRKAGADVVGVSADSVKSHCSFIDKKKLSITLLSDEKHGMLEAYGVWGTKKFMGREYLGVSRSTYLIDPKGMVVKVWEKVSPLGHAKEVLEAVQQAAKKA